MRSRLRKVLVCVLPALVLAACSSPKPAEPSGGGESGSKTEHFTYPGLRVNAFLQSILDEPLPPLAADQPELASAEEYLARATRDWKDKDRRLADICRAVRLSPNEPKCWQALGYSNRSDDSAELIRCARIHEGAAELDGSHGTYWLSAGQTYVRVEGYKSPSAARCFNKAIPLYTAEIATSPTITHLIWARGMCYDYLGEWANALKDYEKWIELNPDCDAYHFSNAFDVAGKIPDPEKQAFYMEKAARKDPKYWKQFADAQLKRAFADLDKFSRDASGRQSQEPQRGWLETALTACREARKFDPKDEDSAENEADCLYYLGRFSECVDLNKTLEWRAWMKDHMERWASALYRLGRFQEAIELVDKLGSGDSDLRLRFVRAQCKADLSFILSYFQPERDKLGKEAIEEFKSIQEKANGPDQDRALALSCYTEYCFYQRDTTLLNLLGTKLEDRFAHLEKPCMEMVAIVTAVRAAKNAANRAELEKILGDLDARLKDQDCGWTMVQPSGLALAWLVREEVLEKLSRLQGSDTAALARERLRSLDRALELRPAYPQALAQRVVVNSALNQVDRMEADCAAAIALHPRFTLVIHYRLVVRQSQSKWKESIEDAQTLIRMDPGNLMIRTALALALLETGEPDRALTELGQVLAADPKHRWAIECRAQVHMRKEEWKEALADMNAVLALAPDARCYDRRSRCFEALRDLDNSIADMDLALKLAPGDVDYLRRRGGLLLSTLKWKEAEADLTAVISGGHPTAEDYANRSTVRQQLALEARSAKLMSDCLDDFERARKAGYSQDDYYPYLLYQRGKRTEAAAAITELGDKAGYFSGWVESQLLLEDGKREEAIKRRRRLVEQFPKNWATHANLGESLNALEQWQEALDCLNIAASMMEDPHYFVLIQRATALIGLGRFQRAREDLESALKKVRERKSAGTWTKECDLARVYSLRSAAHGDKGEKDDLAREDRVLAAYNLKEATKDPFFIWEAAKVDPAFKPVMKEKSVVELFEGH